MLWASKRDRARLVALEIEIDRYQRAGDDGMVRRLQRQRQMLRTYPLSIWLLSVAVVLPLALWVVLYRHGHGGLGLLLGGALAIAELAGALERRRRRRDE